MGRSGPWGSVLAGADAVASGANVVESGADAVESGACVDTGVFVGRMEAVGHGPTDDAASALFSGRGESAESGFWNSDGSGVSASWSGTDVGRDGCPTGR